MALNPATLQLKIDTDIKTKLMQCSTKVTNSSGEEVVVHPFNSVEMLAATGVNPDSIKYKGKDMSFTDILSKIISEVISTDVLNHIVSNAQVNTNVTTTVAPGIIVTAPPPSGAGATTAPGSGTGTGTGVII